MCDQQSIKDTGGRVSRVLSDSYSFVRKQIGTVPKPTTGQDLTLLVLEAAAGAGVDWKAMPAYEDSTTFCSHSMAFTAIGAYSQGSQHGLRNTALL